MLPAGSRVKLNRVALRDVVGVKVAPRQRRPQNKKNPAVVHSPTEPVNSQQEVGDVSDAPGNIPGGEPEESCADIRNSPPDSTELSEGSAPQWNTVGIQGPNSASPESEPPSVKIKIKKENNATEKKIVIWVNKNPKVTLCDVAKKCDACGHDCGYVLPDDLKTKVVHCFKRDMRAGVRFWPGCLGHGKTTGSFCRPQSLTGHQKPLEGGADSQMLSSRTSYHFHQSWTREDSATCSASFPPGQHTDKGETGMWGGGPEDDPGPDSDPIGPENSSDKIIKLGDSVESSGTFSSAGKQKACSQRDGPTDTDAMQMLSSEVLSPESEEDTDDSFSCQRVRAYVRKINASCARTYMCWPFLSNRLSSHSDGKQEESLARLHSDTTASSTRGQCGRKPGTDASYPANGPEAVSTPLRSALGLSDGETAITLSPSSSPLTRGGLSSLSAMPSSSLLLKKDVDLKPVEKSEESHMNPCSFSSFAPLHNSDSILIPRGKHESDEELLEGGSSPKLKRHDAITTQAPLGTVLSNFHEERCRETDSSEFKLPPVLSPVASPQGRPRRGRSSRRSSERSDEEKEAGEKITGRNKTFRACDMTQTDNGITKNPKDCLEQIIEELDCGTAGGRGLTNSTEREPQSNPSNDEDVQDGDAMVKAETMWNGGNASCEEIPSDPTVQTSLSSGVVTEPYSSPSSDQDDAAAFSDEGQQCSAREEEEEGSSSCTVAGGRRDESGDSQANVLDEFTAYEQDILLVDVIQDDPELFDSIPQHSAIKLGPQRVSWANKSKLVAVKWLSSGEDGASVESKQRFTSVTSMFPCDSPDIKEETNNRPWRPRCSTAPTEIQNNTYPATDRQTTNVGQSNANNNHVNSVLERTRSIQTVSAAHNIPPLMMSIGPGLRIPNSAGMADFRRQKSNAYCRQYFSESLSCGFKMCRFQHLPVEGDEKFCMETVARFTKNPMCFQKAGAVFTGYYQNNPPGVFFSMPVLLTLLWALLKAGMVADIFSVLTVSLAHNMVPGHEFLLALFNCVREKGLQGFVPELMQLTFKMASAGLELSLDCLDCVKNTPVLQQTGLKSSPASASGNHKLSTNACLPEYLNLTHAIVEIELCTKQEDWKRMGEAFQSICQSSQPLNHVERISGHIAIALLSESKDKLSLPFAVFAETVCQNEGEDSLVRSFVGRIGVSLMLRYHKTHQWAKGRRVVEILSISKVKYSGLKGLFGNEDGASRCYLITVATELFLLSGSVEGALLTLRENKWFLSSSLWPCEPADLESRTRVLLRLAEQTSHRDTLEVLCNLPGIKEPNDSINITRYSPLFNSHLQVCVDRQILPVASDTVDVMLSRNLLVDHTVLQTLLHKLAKQNHWLRAREVFRHSLTVGYYPGVSAPSGFMALIVPSRLGEVELALTFEMFITVNATAILQLPEGTTSSLSITLKRAQSCESEYLSAGSRLLSAGLIPQPKLSVHYTAVNSSQEQVFTLDVASARRWLRHNHLWAHEVWTQ